MKRITSLFLLAFWFSGIFVSGLPTKMQAQDLQDSLIINGYKKYFYPNGVLSSEGLLRDGRPDGYWKAYYETGTIKSEGNRVNFELDSIWKFYNEKGELILETNYEKGRKNGIKTVYLDLEIVKENYINDIKEGYTRTYYKNGALKSEIPFIHGIEQGLGKEYAADGTTITLIEYKKGFTVDRLRINRYDNNKQRQGRWYQFYPCGAVQSEGNYKNDKKNGFFKDFAENGDLIRISKYINDTLQPEAVETLKPQIINDYYPNGNIMASTMYRNGTPEGVKQEYREDGTILKSTIFNNGFVIGEGLIKEDGNKEGPWKEFYPGGSIRAEGSYDNGKQTGEWKFYHTNGNLEQTGRYNKNGNPEGTWKWYFESGSKKREENFRNGKRDGLYTEFDERSRIIEQGEFVDGLEEGRWYMSTGDACYHGDYREGLKNGMWYNYFLIRKGDRVDSILIFRGNFIEDNPDGKHSYYYENGKLSDEGFYVMGKKEGDWLKNNSDGSPFMIITYRNGIEIKYDGVRIKPPFEEEAQP